MSLVIHFAAKGRGAGGCGAEAGKAMGSSSCRGIVFHVVLGHLSAYLAPNVVGMNCLTLADLPEA